MRRLARTLIVACALIPLVGSVLPAGAQTPVTGLLWSPCFRVVRHLGHACSRTYGLPAGFGVHHAVGSARLQPAGRRADHDRIESPAGARPGAADR